MNESPQNTPIWFTITNVLLLLWNLFGLAVFVLAVFVFNNREALENAGLNEEQIDVTLAAPTWVNIAFGVAVIFGAAGCLCLLLKKKVAVPLLIISLAGVIAQNVYMYLLSDTVEIMGVGASPMVIAVAIAIVPYILYSAKRGWLK